MSRFKRETIYDDDEQPELDSVAVAATEQPDDDGQPELDSVAVAATEQPDDDEYGYVPISAEMKQFFVFCGGILLALDNIIREADSDLIMITMACLFMLESLFLTKKNKELPILGPLKEYSLSGAVLSTLNVMLRAWGGYLGMHAAIDILSRM
jgi:hypothetical protein